MNHLLQSICPEEENARPKTCYFVIGKPRFECSRARKNCSQKGTRTNAWAMCLRIVHGGDSNGQYIVEEGKQRNDQKHNQLRSAGLLDSGCLLRATRRVVWTAYRTHASSCVLLCRSSLRGGVRFAFHARNAQKRFGPRARYRSDCHIRIRHRLAAGDRAIGRQRAH